MSCLEQTLAITPIKSSLLFRSWCLYYFLLPKFFTGSEYTFPCLSCPVLNNIKVTSLTYPLQLICLINFIYLFLNLLITDLVSCAILIFQYLFSSLAMVFFTFFSNTTSLLPWVSSSFHCSLMSFHIQTKLGYTHFSEWICVLVMTDRKSINKCTHYLFTLPI